MAHAMTATDRAAYTRAGAWHGLGNTYDADHLTREHLAAAGWLFGVVGVPLRTEDGREITTHKAICREDTQEILGVVGSDWTPIQNAEMLGWAEELAQATGGSARIETAGTFRGGRRVYLLLQRESFQLPEGADRTIADEIRRYCLLANGHDGGFALRALWTDVRVVCRNTWRASLKGRNADGYTLRHTSGIQGRAQEIGQALGLWDKAAAAEEEQAGTLDARTMTREELQRFWLDVYTATEGAIPDRGTDKAAQRKRDAAHEAMNSISRRFDRERNTLGQQRPSTWMALQAYTGWRQHDRTVRAANDRVRNERRIEHALMGTAADDTLTATRQALELATA